MKRAFLVVGLAILGLTSCVSPGRNFYAETHRAVRWKAPVGSDIRLARQELLADGYDVSLPYDPTNLGEVYWVVVRYHKCPSRLDQEFYGDQVRSICPPLGVVIESDQNGIIQKIR